MDFKDDSSRVLFMKYALPCSPTLVKRGSVSRYEIKKLIKIISQGEKVSSSPEKLFKTAYSMCVGIAKSLGKSNVDKNVIRKYFLFEHDKIVDRRYDEFGDFNAMRCRTFAGIVVNTNKMIVQTIIGRRKYRNDLVSGLKKGDSVVVHRDFVVERINERLAKKLWNLKQIYLKSDNK
ncbi:hypothetical protein A3K64_01050 [Candidatus Micrarchaeota archaeon RBG_16_36_9]|nr:MAG: hypothetical protein A3K64_01050 [Candidatus Micrarchaeota archaeon RBG_16_36_9]